VDFFLTLQNVQDIVRFTLVLEMRPEFIKPACAGFFLFCSRGGVSMDQDLCMAVLVGFVMVAAALVFWTRRLVPLTPAVRARDVAVMSVATAGAGAVAGCAAASVAARRRSGPAVDLLAQDDDDDGLCRAVGLGFMSAVCDGGSGGGEPAGGDCSDPGCSE
jgi:hypothetical protein